MAGASGIAILGAVAPIEASVAVDAPSFRIHRDHVLGTSFDMTAVAPDDTTARLAAGAALAEIARLDRVLSGFRDDSELAALNAVGSMRVSPDLFTVLARCEHWRRETGGAFSGRLGQAIASWRTAMRDGRPVDADALRAAAERANRAEVVLDAASQTVTRPDPVCFALDALAKGYIVDAALAAARRAAPGLVGLMIDIGGDLRVWGRAPRPESWRVGLADPTSIADNAPPAAILALNDRAMATSGRGQRDMRLEGRRVSHILAPDSGQPAERVIAASVVAGNAADADALATAFSVLPPRRGLELADRLPGVAARFVTADGETMQSTGWHALDATPRRTAMLSLPRASKPLPATPAQAAASAPWPAGFAVSIDYEIPKFEADDYRAPYLLVWITDEKRQLVRTLLMLGKDSKWVDSNYVWWRRYGRKTPEIVDAMGRPTRLPGRYNLAWDGKDEAGKPVAQGKYLVHVEAAREHGGHTYHFTEMDLGAAPADRPVPAKDELGGIRIQYGPTK